MDFVILQLKKLKKMTNDELLDWCQKHIAANNYFSFPEEIFNNLTDAKVTALINNFGSTHLMKMPQTEIDFFEWLKANDISVWNDLWNSEEEPYLISMNFLPVIISGLRGFPICDLLNNDNYYFTNTHLISNEARLMVESVQKMYKAHKQLTVEQALILEISIEPIDIWRFAYRYKISIERAKKAVESLVNESILLHIKDAEHLSGFINL